MPRLSLVTCTISRCHFAAKTLMLTSSLCVLCFLYVAVCYRMTRVSSAWVKVRKCSSSHPHHNSITIISRTTAAVFSWFPIALHNRHTEESWNVTQQPVLKNSLPNNDAGRSEEEVGADTESVGKLSSGRNRSYINLLWTG